MPHQRPSSIIFWAILRVKAAALLRRSAADFSSKNQALTRKMARAQ
jgi:hypothetical protein